MACSINKYSIVLHAGHFRYLTLYDLLDDDMDDLESGPPSMLSPSSAAAAAAAAAQHQLHMMNIITGGHHQDDNSSPSSHKKISPFSIDSLLSSVKVAAAAHKVKLEKEAEQNRRNYEEDYVNDNKIKSEGPEDEEMENNKEDDHFNGRSSVPSSLAGSPNCPSLSPRSPHSSASNNNNNTPHYINSMIPTSPSNPTNSESAAQPSSSPPTSNPSSPNAVERHTQLLPQLPFSAASLLLQNHAAAVAARAAAVQAAQANVSLLKPITASPEKNILLQSIQQQKSKEDMFLSASTPENTRPTSTTPPMTAT